MVDFYTTWLPWIVGAIGLHWAVPARFRPYALPLAGLAFLLTYAWASALLLGGLTAAMWRFAPRRHGWLLLPGAVVLALVVVAETATGEDGTATVRALTLLGAAYYVLRALHYVIEARAGNLPPHQLRDVFAYMFFLPTLPIGPITRFDDFLRELRRLRWDAGRFSAGLERILHGYAKVLLVAGLAVDTWLRDYNEHVGLADPRLAAYLESVQVALGLYFRFAGYSDIAIGFALALGIRVAENFDAPLTATSVADFWRRWHMSLGAWIRDYVYLPLAARTGSPALAAVGGMAVVGLWHGGSPRFLLWGLYHGLGLAAWMAFQRHRPRFPAWLEPGWKVVAWALTFNFVVLGFVITNAPDTEAALRTFRLIFGLG